MGRKQMAQGINSDVDLGVLLARAAVIALRWPLSGLERKVWLSKMTVLGWAVRPALSLGRTRKSCAMAAKQP